MVAKNCLGEAIAVAIAGELPVGGAEADRELEKFDKPVAKAPVVKKPAAKKRTRSRNKKRA
ncbi:MAG TPA: hypothetical protein DIW64_16190 [Cellvibrio sp.]|nr:hypothetical protein [Cellvibrio sp.]